MKIVFCSPYVGGKKRQNIWKDKMALDTFVVVLRTTELQKEQNPPGYSHLTSLRILLAKTFLIMLLTSNISTWLLSKGLWQLCQNIVEVANICHWRRTRSHCKNKASEQILFYSYLQLLWCCFFSRRHHSRHSVKFSSVLSLLCVRSSMPHYGLM